MKPTRDEREKLAQELRRLQEVASLSRSRLAKLAKVDPGQTSRILDGEFKTLGGNVVRICNVLGIDPHACLDKPSSAKQARTQAAWATLEASVRRAWDKTPLGAERLAAVIDAVAQVRTRKGTKAAKMEASMTRRAPSQSE